MKNAASWVRKYPLVAFFLLTLTLVWLTTHPAVPTPVALFITTLLPMIFAAVITAFVKGKSGLKELFGRLLIWRIGAVWYAFVLGLPILLGLMAIFIYSFLINSSPVKLGVLSPPAFMYYILAVGEEVGWRGFALPRLLKKRKAVLASLLLGFFWSVYHLVLFLPSGSNGVAMLLPGTIILIAYSILITWIFKHTQGSLVPPVLFHGTQSLVVPIFYGGMTLESIFWLQAALYGTVAFIVLIFTGPDLSRKNGASR